MFELGTDWSTDDLDVAVAGCVSPPGCGVLDTQTGSWSNTPESMEEIEAAQARLSANGHCSKRDDLRHCPHWWDGEPCCDCGARAMPEQERADQGMEPSGRTA